MNNARGPIEKKAIYRRRTATPIIAIALEALVEMKMRAASFESVEDCVERGGEAPLGRPVKEEDPLESESVPLRRSALRMKAATLSSEVSLLLIAPTFPAPHAPGKESKNQIGVLLFEESIGTVRIVAPVPLIPSRKPESNPLLLVLVV